LPIEALTSPIFFIFFLSENLLDDERFGEVKAEAGLEAFHER
jgi:hypothetical protein